MKRTLHAVKRSVFLSRGTEEDVSHASGRERRWALPDAGHRYGCRSMRARPAVGEVRGGRQGGRQSLGMNARCAWRIGLCDRSRGLVVDEMVVMVAVIRSRFALRTRQRAFWGCGSGLLSLVVIEACTVENARTSSLSQSTRWNGQRGPRRPFGGHCR